MSGAGSTTPKFIEPRLHRSIRPKRATTNRREPYVLGYAFDAAYRRLIERFDELMLETRSRHPDCVRIWKRLYQHCDELFTFLDDPAVPADNNGTERDIRSLVAARNDGGTHRAD
jgi:Transposase IS66 family